MPWRLLDNAAARSITVGVILNRVPPGAAADVLPDLRGMLDQRGLPGAPVFVIDEQPLDDLGMLPPTAVEAPRAWLESIAGDRAERARVAARTLRGAVDDLDRRVQVIADARRQQLDWVESAVAAVAREYELAVEAVDDATKDGALLRGEVLARWQDFVGTSDVFRRLEGWVSRARDQATAWLRGRPQSVVEVETQIELGLHAVIVDQGGSAAGAAWASLQRSAAGQSIARQHPGLRSESADFAETSATLVRDWQGALMRLVQQNAGSKRVRARVLSLGLNVVTVALMVVVFASTGGLTGGEVAIAGGSAVVGQKLLETIFGEDAVRRLALEARRDLQQRVRALFDGEAARVTAALAEARMGASPEVLRRESEALLDDVERAAASGDRP